MWKLSQKVRLQETAYGSHLDGWYDRTNADWAISRAVDGRRVTGV